MKTVRRSFESYSHWNWSTDDLESSGRRGLHESGMNTKLIKNIPAPQHVGIDWTTERSWWMDVVLSAFSHQYHNFGMCGIYWTNIISSELLHWKFWISLRILMTGWSADEYNTCLANLDLSLLKQFHCFICACWTSFIIEIRHIYLTTTVLFSQNSYYCSKAILV